MGVLDGRKRLIMLRLHEFNEDLEDSGTEQHLVLELEPALTIRRFHVSRTPDGKQMQMQVGEDIVPVIGGAPLFYIPAVIFGPYNLSPDTERSPMLDLVDVNVAHFQNSADLEHALWMTEAHKKQILAVYEAAERLTEVTGIEHEVDHLVPLFGQNKGSEVVIRGLHVPWNLRAIPRALNRKRGDWFYVRDAEGGIASSDGDDQVPF